MSCRKRTQPKTNPTETMVKTNTLKINESLNIGDSLTSENNFFQLTLLKTGNLDLVNLKTKNTLWSSNRPKLGTKATLITDGNFEITDAAGAVIWSTSTYNEDIQTLVLRNDGNVVILDSLKSVIWATNSYSFPEGLTTNFINQHVYIWNNVRVDSGGSVQPESAQFMTDRATHYADRPGIDTLFHISLDPYTPQGRGPLHFILNLANGGYLTSSASKLSRSTGPSEVIELIWVGPSWGVRNHDNGGFYGRSASKLSSSPETYWHISLASEFGDSIQTGGMLY